MKKGLILTTSLAMVLGVGVAVGAHRAKAAEGVRADGNPYGSDWYVTGTVNGQGWGDWQKIATHNTDKGRYELEVEVTTSSQFKIFNAASYDAAYQINRAMNETYLDYDNKGWLEYTDWADGDNFKMKEGGTFVIYFLDGVEGYNIPSWAFGIEKAESPEPPEPVDPDVPTQGNGYYLVGTKTNWKYKDAIKLDEDADENDAKLLHYDSDLGEEFKVRKYEEGKEDVWYGTGAEWNQNYVVEVNAYLDIFINSEHHLWVNAVPDEPAEEGYYMVGSKTKFRYEGATAMVHNVDGANVAYLFGYEAEVNEKIKVREFYNAIDKWAVNTNGSESAFGHEDEDHNFVFDVAGEYDIYAYYEGDDFKFSVAEAADHVEIRLIAAKFAGKQSQGSVTIAQLERVQGQKFSVGVREVEGYVQLGAYTDPEFQHPFEEETVINENTYIYIKYMEKAFYLTGDDTFLGEGHGWKVEYSSKIEGDATNKLVGTVDVPEGVDAEHPMKVKPLEYVADAGEGNPGWAGASYEQGWHSDEDPEKDETPDFVYITEGKDFAFTKPGTYAFYINNEDKVWFNGGEWAFHEKFLSQIGGTCDAQGKTTDLEVLGVKWGEMEVAYNKLSPEEQKNIKDIGFDGGNEESPDSRLRMIAMYHYIVCKYGSAVFANFIWDVEVPAESIINSPITSEDAGSMTIIIAVASISILSVGLLIFLKKKKAQR